MSTKEKNTKTPSSTFKKVLDGTPWLKETIKQHWSLLMLFFVMGFFLIASNYNTERMVRKTIEIKKEVKQLRYKHLSTEARRMYLSRQSSLSKLLQPKGIKESVVPPYKLIKTEIKEQN